MCASNVSAVAIPMQTSHAGKYDPRRLNAGDLEHPLVGTKTGQIARAVQIGRVFLRRHGFESIGFMDSYLSDDLRAGHRFEMRGH
jgi:hypothetical protein